MSVTINGTSGVTFNDASSQNTAATGFGFKNRIINGAMVIDQRNAGASVTATTAAPYTLDRWLAYSSTPTSKFTVQQNAGSVTPPAGYTNYLGAISSSAYSLGTSDVFVINQNIEGFNIADLAWGTANAKTVTLSFQVYSSLTGTFGGVLRNSADNRSYPFTYSIPVANTWTSISVTIAGDTSGTWLTNNGIGIRVSFGLGVGSSLSGTAGAWAGALYQGATGATSVVGTLNATWQVTGVQLEKGSTATSFDYRPYGTELQLCQRYAFNFNSTNANGTYLRYAVGPNNTTTQAEPNIRLPVTMRITPSLTAPAVGQFALYSSATLRTVTGLGLDAAGFSPNGGDLVVDVASGLTTGGASSFVSNNNNTSYLLFTAEL
jgi:hypothetical protein